MHIDTHTNTQCNRVIKDRDYSHKEAISILWRVDHLRPFRFCTKHPLATKSEGELLDTACVASAKIIPPYRKPSLSFLCMQYQVAHFDSWLYLCYDACLAEELSPVFPASYNGESEP